MRPGRDSICSGNGFFLGSGRGRRRGKRGQAEGTKGRKDEKTNRREPKEPAKREKKSKTSNSYQPQVFSAGGEEEVGIG